MAPQPPAFRTRLLDQASILDLSTQICPVGVLDLSYSFEEDLHSTGKQTYRSSSCSRFSHLSLLVQWAPALCSMVVPAQLLALSVPICLISSVVPAAGSSLSILQCYRPTSIPRPCAEGRFCCLHLPWLPLPMLREQGESPRVGTGRSWLPHGAQGQLCCVGNKEPCWAQGALFWKGPHSSPTPGLPHSLPSWGTYICPASGAEMLDGRPDSGQRLPLGQVEKLEVVVEGREGLKGKRQKCH